jgi:hypothetical protein
VGPSGSESHILMVPSSSRGNLTARSMRTVLMRLFPRLVSFATRSRRVGESGLGMLRAVQGLPRGSVTWTYAVRTKLHSLVFHDYSIEANEERPSTLIRV